MAEQHKATTSRRPGLISTPSASFMSSSSALSFRHESNLTSVYIQDDAYSWLPAKILRTDGDQVTVSIVLPSHWHDSTVLSRDSTIDDVEDALLLSLQEQRQPPPLSMSSSSSQRTTSSSSSSWRSHRSLAAATRTVRLSEYPHGELPLQNVIPYSETATTYTGKRDMADLPFLHEAAILYNLKDRHYHQQPYTRVGDIVVAMNPFTWMHELYSPATRDVYSQNLVWQVPADPADSDEFDDDGSPINTFGSMYDKLGFDPHVYETSSLAYRGLAIEGRDQTILVSGESGAGKTETVKIVMSHLATLEQSRPIIDGKNAGPYVGGIRSGDGDSTITRVLESSPVFEAFGNAKTLRNDNSSRFGKFTQLQFDVEALDLAQRNGRHIPLCSLAGSVCVTYLLEKSRVVSHSKGERTYHIFYQLLKAPDEYKGGLWPELAGTTCEDFGYIGPTSVESIDGVPDEEQWPRTLEALKVFQFEGDSLETLMRALCVVLQLGNLTFDHDPEADIEEGGTVITSVDELDKLSKLIGIAPELIESAMTLRVIKTGYDEVQVQLRPSVAKESCDALAKEIYARVFDVLVRNINEYTRAEKNKHSRHGKYGTISLLDIFGFERFQVNRFEQLCINYANEQLQHKYVLDNFRQVQEEYESEGIEIFDFSVVDNSNVLKLLEGRIGLIISLNEECIRPKGNDEAFVYKIKMMHKDHECLIDEKLHRNTEFGVKHFAGPVTYDSTKFVERNTDKLPDGLMYCTARSTNKLIREEFETLVAAHEANESSGIRRKKATNRTVLEKFRTQLKELMASMEDTTTRYIRCIKPNESMTPKLTEHNITMRQLECAGLVTAIAISRESFPNRLGYDGTKERFECLMNERDLKKMAQMNVKDSVNYMLTALLRPAPEKISGIMKLPFACGKTRVYFRAGALEDLETKRLGFYTARVVTIQCWIRMIRTKAKYDSARHAIIRTQAAARGRLQLGRYRKQRAAATTLACWARGRRATATLDTLRSNHAATVVQSRWRSRSKAAALIRFRHAAAVIQRAVRTKKNKTNFTAKLALAVEEARMDNKLLGLKQQVAHKNAALPKSGKPMVTGRTVNESLLEEVETMFDYLRKEIFMLRGKNADLRAELHESENDKREILAHAESAEAAASSSRLRVAQLTKTNAVLVKEAMEHKQEAGAVRKELKSAGISREEELNSVKITYERILEERDNEIKSLQLNIKQGRSSFAQEKKLLHDEMTKMEDEHLTEILRLKDELRKTQDSHHDYLAKLMDVLETTHAARESETARISAELNAVKEQKDTQIIRLQREVETLRKLHKKDVPVMRDDLSSKKMEMGTIRNELDRSSAARRQRAQKFNEVAQKLENIILPDQNQELKPGARRLVSRKSPKDPGVSEEDLVKMKKMVRFLGDLYALEETSQAKIDQDVMTKLNNYLVASEPYQVIIEMRGKVSKVEAENAELKEHVLRLATCPRCEARDRRRSLHRTSAKNHRHDYSGT